MDYEIAPTCLEEYEISEETFLPFEAWKEKYQEQLQHYPPEFDLKPLWLDIAAATYLLGFPVPAHVLPPRGRIREAQLDLTSRVVNRVLVYGGFPRTYGGLYQELRALKTPATHSNHAFALLPELPRNVHRK